MSPEKKHNFESSPIALSGSFDWVEDKFYPGKPQEGAWEYQLGMDQKCTKMTSERFPGWYSPLWWEQQRGLSRGRLPRASSEPPLPELLVVVASAALLPSRSGGSRVISFVIILTFWYNSNQHKLLNIYGTYIMFLKPQIAVQCNFPDRDNDRYIVQCTYCKD